MIHRAHVLALASFSLGLFVSARGSAASLVEVNRSDWAGSVKLPSYIQMYIYVPDKLAMKPPIMVSSHSCGSTATGQMGNIPLSKAAADKNGFIMILPDNPGQNCWDVGTKQSLTHDGGGDTQAVAQMVKYALQKYSGDPARVYAMGGSSGAMMTQALMAVYPDVFRAGSARAGVPAGCWSDGYDSGQQWSNNCAGGNTTKTAQAWGDLARGMDSGYMGHRPRLQIMQGESDTTISYKNTAESIKQWTNVLGLSTDPTTTDKGYKAANATYDRQFWQNSCSYVVFEAWSSPGGTHSMPYEEADILKFFGLDPPTDADPEPDCTGGGSSGGTGGAPGSGGMGSGGKVGAAGAVGAGGMVGAAGMVSAGGNVGGAGRSGSSAGTGGVVTGAGGSGGTGARASGGGGSGGTGAQTSTGGTTTTGSGGTGGSVSTPSGGKTSTGGSVSTGASSGHGSSGKSNTGNSGDDSPSPSVGCGCVVSGVEATHTYSAGAIVGLALLALRRRRRAGR
jgi:poly(hydroxyalkanoate) depolymerase family esterase